MTDAMEALRAHFGRQRIVGRSADCLPEEIIEGLADGSLLVLETVGRAHFEACARCLSAYAETRSLLEAGAVTPAAITSARRDPRGTLRGLAGARVPLGWAAAAVAAAALVTWLISSEIERLQTGPVGFRPVAVVSHRDGSAVRAVAGVVERIKDTSAADLTTHVIELRLPRGELCTVFVWGAPTVRVGDHVIVDGVFTTAGDAGGRPGFKGVANVVRVAP